MSKEWSVWSWPQSSIHTLVSMNTFSRARPERRITAHLALVAVGGGGAISRYPITSAVRTASAVTSGGVWNTPKPSAGISTPLFEVTLAE